MAERDGRLPTRSELCDKLTTVQEIIYRAIMDSEYLEALQTASNQEEFEIAISEIAYDVVCLMGEGDVDAWTKEDRILWQKQTLEAEIERAQSRLAELNK